MLGAVRSELLALAMSHAHTSIKQMHALVSAAAVPSFHKDVAVGSLLTAMHKYGPDLKCHELDNAAQLKDVLRRVTWTPQPSAISGAICTTDPPQKPTAQKLNTRKLEDSMHSLSKQMEALTTSIENKLQPVNSSGSAIPENHIVIPAQEMHELLAHLEEIKTAPIITEEITKEHDFLQRAKALQSPA